MTQEITWECTCCGRLMHCTMFRTRFLCTECFYKKVAEDWK